MEAKKQLKNFIDMTNFQRIQEEIARGADIAMLTVDYTGNPVTTHSRCRDFCAAVRDNPHTSELCKRCDSRGGIEATRLGRPYIYTCHMGLVDFAIPIIVDEVYLGAILGGQVMAPSGAYEQIVSERTAVPQELSAAYNALPTMPDNRIKEIADMVFYICNYVISEAKVKFNSANALPQADTAPISVPDKNPLKPAITFIEQNFTKDLSLAAMSSLCDISTTYFCKQFKKLTGYNFAHYINMLRIERSKILLKTTNHTVAAIAYEVGFDDCGYFIKVFKRLTDGQLTPQAYRELR